MTYPAPVYLGDTGEVTASIRSGSTPAELPRPGGAAHYLATGTLTAGRFGLYRWDMGNAWVDGGPGDFAYVPDGGIHGFRNDSGAPASLLILSAPGAPREAYFEGLVEMAEGRWTPSHEELLAFCEEHDNIYV